METRKVEIELTERQGYEITTHCELCGAKVSVADTCLIKVYRGGKYQELPVCRKCLINPKPAYTYIN
jgi:hypothetical protein